MKPNLGILAACILVFGCGGQANPAPDASSPEDGAAKDGAYDSGDASSDACSPGSAIPTYDCDAGTGDAAGCPAWGSTSGPPFYPVGCHVTTPPTQTTFGCTPLTCSCLQIPGNGYGFTCPM